ncbi:hypothetical protein BGW41_007014 [Actinomortierella wolfii]|nr:hypothetical protein BGW41_007014 [Actinomortierella wolfii]
MNVLLSPSTSTRPSLPLPPRHDNSRPSDEETDTDDEATESERDTDAGATESEHESHQSRVRRASESRLDTTRGPICGIFESKSGKVIDILQAALDGEDSGVEDDGDLNSFKKWLLLLKNDKIFQDKTVINDEFERILLATVVIC